MLLREFEKLQVVNLLDKLRFNVGDVFLTQELEEQKYNKKAGQEVVVYKVIEVKLPDNIVYMPAYLILE